MASADSRVTLPITPMLDMTFQLLFFFIINFHPADLEGQLDMALPSEEIKAAQQKKDIKKDVQPEKDPSLDFPSDLTVRIRSQQDEANQGGISALFVRNLEGKEEAVNGLDGLRRYLEEKRAGLTNKEAVKVLGDSKLRIKNVLKVMDICRKAGFKDVSFLPPEDLNR
ncbi:MAG: ExbD/TolR family protein [Gemmataceae bacterium]